MHPQFLFHLLDGTRALLPSERSAQKVLYLMRAVIVHEQPLFRIYNSYGSSKSKTRLA